MARLFVLLTTCVAFVNSLNNFLVQGRADTLRVLKKIIKERDSKVMPLDPFSAPSAAWQPFPEPTDAAWQPSIPRDTATRSFHEASKKLEKRGRRDIRNAVIESGHCEHIELMDCSDFDTEEMTCMFTANGMECCVCTGTLRANKWNLF